MIKTSNLKKQVQIHFNIILLIYHNDIEVLSQGVKIKKETIFLKKKQ